MRKWFIFFSALLGAMALQAVEVGDARTSVIAELGQPIGELQLGDKERLLFPTGDVTFIDGKVSGVSLKTPQQLRREAEIRQEQVEYWAGVRAEEQANDLARGRAWLSRLKDDPGAVTAEQLRTMVEHWKMMQEKYPGADIDAEYEATLALIEAREAELREQRRSLRIAALEERVANAERRAAEAQREAYEARNASYGGYYGGYYYPRSVVVVGGGVYCGPRRVPYPNTGNCQPVLRAGVTTGNFTFRYSSGRSACGPSYQGGSVFVAGN